MAPMTVEEDLADSAGGLISYAARQSDALLARLEGSAGVSLNPKECSRLFSVLGELEFSPWLSLLKQADRPVFGDLVSRLEDRLRNQVKLRRDDLALCVSRGLQLEVAKIEGEIAKIAHRIRAGEKGGLYVGPDEFDSEIISLFESAWYALRLCELIGLSLQGELRNKGRDIESTLKKILPEVLNDFRVREERVPQVYLELFPKSFWWRRVLSPTSLSEE